MAGRPAVGPSPTGAEKATAGSLERRWKMMIKKMKVDDVDDDELAQGHQKRSRSKLPALGPSNGNAADSEPARSDSDVAKAIKKSFAPNRSLERFLIFTFRYLVFLLVVDCF